MRSALAALIGACAACASTSGAESAAVIIESSVASREELRRTVASALNRETVLLADDALTRESELVLEPARLRDPTGGLAQGRELRMPERFRLVKVGSDCVLIHEGSGMRMPLNSAKCMAKK